MASRLWEILRAAYWTIVDTRAWRRFIRLPGIWHLLFRYVPKLTLSIVPADTAFPNTDKRHVEDSEAYDTPELMSMDIIAMAQRHQKPTHRTPELHIRSVPGALYCPRTNALMNRRRDVAAESVLSESGLASLDRKALSRKTVRSLSGTATALRSTAPGYYHTLIDALPRLDVLDRYIPPDQKIQLLRPSEGPQIIEDLETHFVDQLYTGRAEIVKIADDALYRVENYLLVPHLSRPQCALLPAHYLTRFRSRVLPDRPPDKHQRIYISRKDSYRRQVLNEDALMNALKPLGFQRYRLEEMTVDDQINLFHDAECVVAPHGAGLTNLLFAHSIPVVELFPGPHIIPHFYFLCKALDHTHIPWTSDTTPTEGDHWHGDFRVAVDEVLTLLREHGIRPQRSRNRSSS